MCNINSKCNPRRGSPSVTEDVTSLFLFFALSLASSSPLAVRLIFLGCGQGLLSVFIRFSSSPFSSSQRLYLFLCLSLCVNTHFVRHLPSSFIPFYLFIFLFGPFRLYQALVLRFWQKHFRIIPLSPWLCLCLSVCLRHGFEQLEPHFPYFC